MSSDQEHMDPRVARTRQVLLDALLQLMDEKGSQHITVQDITRRARINRTTFYLHYHSVADMIQSCIQDQVHFLQETMKLTLQEPAFSEEGVKHYLAIFEHIAENSTFYKQMFTYDPNGGFTRLIREVFVEFMTGVTILLKPDDEFLITPRNIAGRYLASGLLGIVIWWVDNGLPYTPKYMATQIARLNLSGPYDGSAPLTPTFDSVVERLE